MKNIVIILLLYIQLFIVSCLEKKIIDPNDPRFEIKNFSFYDYNENAEITKQYYREMFPVGISKLEVEKVLIKYGNAKPFQIKDSDRVWFYKLPKGFESPGHHTAVYDEEGKLINYRIQIEYLYPDQPTAEDLF
jgi:hypothetical protein